MTPEHSEFSLPPLYSTDHRGPVRWVASHAVHHWPWLLLGVFGAFGNAAAGAAVPVLVGRAVNLVRAADPDLRLLLFFALGIAGSQLLRVFLQFARSASFEVVAQNIERSARDELYKSLLGKSMTFHSLQPVGDTMARATNDVRELNFLFNPGINYVVGSVMFLFVPIWVAPAYHRQLLLTPLVFLLLYVLALVHYVRSLAPATERVRASFGKLNERLSESLDGVELIKTAAREGDEVARFAESAKGYRDAMVRQGDIEARFLPMLLLACALAGGLLHALLLFRQGAITLGGVVGYFGTLMLLDFPVFVSMFSYSKVASGLAGARRILELMSRRTPLDRNPGGFRGPMQGAIEFRDVTFGYESGNATLRGLSFRVEPGQTVAVVGHTGSGKTTLAKLINRTYDVGEGAVSVDGVDVREWSLTHLRRGISIIEQDIFLFSKTVGENISFGCPEAGPAEVEAAARAAQAHGFIHAFREGYQTPIGERGVTLSGGQRQRLALARAFLTDPGILILDDSTSAVDSATEDEIQKAIYAAAARRTTLIITHRLSQIRWADLILVLRNGAIEAAGSHEELLATSPAYQRIFAER